jgi:trimethylamine--corrinoid protein Co-methyltransferase
MFSKYYRTLDNEKVTRVHEASFEVLQKTGIRVRQPQALEKLAAAGARVDSARERVCLPPQMVEDSVAQSPETFLCAGRSAEYDFTVGNSSLQPPVFRTVAGPIYFFDSKVEQARPLGIKDCADIAHLVDALDHLNILATLTPQDIPQQTYDIEILKVHLENSRKHIWALTTDSKNLKYQLEMMVAIAGGSRQLQHRPICSGIVCLIDPLSFPDDEIERLLLYGQYNLPVRVPLCPIVGANAPYTLAGAIVQANAEALGSLTLLQSLCPGIPTWYYPIVQLMDMRKGITGGANPESLLILNALCCMARRYGLPSSATGMANSSYQPHQTMLERSTSITAVAMAGISELGGVGGLGSGMMVSPIAAAIDHELIGFVKRFLKGIEIDTDTLATEAINRVGHSGNFLEDSHTLNHLRREERFTPSLLTEVPYREWKEDPRTIYDRAGDQIAHIRKHHEVPPLEPDLQKELDIILTAAKKELGVS